MRPPMRSSVACLRCRRSKIKCDNDGGNSPCDNCIRGGHQCQYPEATTLPPKRNEPPGSGKQDREGPPERKRLKKAEDGLSLDGSKSAAYAEEVLSYPFMTPELWGQLLAIYRVHFSTELSFIHLPTLKERISRRQSSNYEASPELNLVLLGILTLTARFHPDLAKYVAHLSTTQTSANRPRASVSKLSPYVASEFFAGVLATALGPLKTSMTVLTVDRVQAFLMLGLFEWSQGGPNRAGAWMYVGMAIRMAQALRLGHDDLVARARGGLGLDSKSGPKARAGSLETGIIREIRRRTMFSCLILDRLMASGNDRMAVIRPSNIHIQLPCTEMAFDLALDVRTGCLRSEDITDYHAVNDDSVLARFIQMVEIWGDVSKYCSTGGRHSETASTWDDPTTYGELRDKLERFGNNLPESFVLSRQNYYRHDNHQATNMYLSLHMLQSVAQIVLCREFLPFLPLGCRRPEGPLDSSSRLQEHTSSLFWESTARSVFKAARDIVDLVEIARDKLPNSALAMFAVWTAAFWGIYAFHFPHMDTEQQMVKMDEIERLGNEDDGILQVETASLAYQALHKMVGYSPNCENYLKYFDEVDRYFSRARREYLRKPGDKGPAIATATGRTQRFAPGPGGELAQLPGDDRQGDTTQMAGLDAVPRPDDATRHQGAKAEQRALATPYMGAIYAPDASRQPHETHPILFTAANSRPWQQPRPPTEPASSPATSRQEDASGAEARRTNRIQRGSPRSELMLPDFDIEELPQGFPEFTTENAHILESRRIGSMLNDLEEFSGAGCLGMREQHLGEA